MVWGGVSALGKTPLVFIPEGVKVNAKRYKDLILEKHVKRIGITFVKKENWIIQQDGAPAHTAIINQDWLSKNVPNFISRDHQPPSRPDLNPCDFYLWRRLEEKVNSKAYDNIPALKQALTKVWGELDQNEVARACKTFQDQLSECLRAKGKRFESTQYPAAIL